MKFTDSLFIKITTSNSSLVANNDHEVASFFNLFYRFRSSRNKLEIFNLMKVVFNKKLMQNKLNS